MRHVGQGEQPDQRVGRVVEEALERRELDVIRVGIDTRADHHDHRDGEEHTDLRGIELQAAIGDARRADQPALTQESAAEGDRRGHTGDEHEHIGGIADAVPRGYRVIEGVAATMGDEDDEHRHAAEEVEPRVTGCRGVLRCRRVGQAAPQSIRSLAGIGRNGR